ncbi:hypothetical protein F4806DRAFT_447142 [Annulohypoxylon nitens]|nr:hypothetical protein F4806DRAFT_447142 [Annulohypoxylon nitens]
MRNSRSVCLLCRHIATAKGAARNLQHQPQILQFVTKAQKADDLVNLAMGIYPSNPEPPEPPEPPDPLADEVETFRIRKTTPNPPYDPVERIRKQHMPRPFKDPRLFKNPKYSLARRTKKRDSFLVDQLFQQIVREQQAVAKGEEVQPTKRAIVNTEKEALFEIMKGLGVVEQMVNKGEPGIKIYEYFQKNIYRPILNLDLRALPHAYAIIVERMTDAVHKAKLAVMRSPEFPPVSVMLLNSTKVSGPQPRKWNRLVGALVQEIVKLDAAEETPDSSLVDDGDGLYTKEAMLDDLLECWKLLSLPSTALTSKTDDDILQGFWFPRLDKFSLKQLAHHGHFIPAFCRAFPHLPSRELGAPTTILAIATYALLLDPRRTNQDRKLRATRLVSRIAYLIAYVPYKWSDLRRDTMTHFPELLSYIEVQWPKITKNLRDRIEDINDSNTETTPEISSSSTIPGNPPSPAPTKLVDPAVYIDDINERSLAYNLQIAINTRKFLEVNRRWAAFIQADRRDLITPERMEVLRKYPDIFDLFIHARMALNQPDKALEVFNTLRIVDIKPTLKTWNGMLDGCKKAHNLNAINNVWNKLVSSKVKMDTKLWTTRLSGLMACEDHEGAIKALKDMIAIWNNPKHSKEYAVKPTIEPVNAVFAGLLAQNKVKEAEQLLAWAQKQGIEPDIFSFNPLLRRYIQDMRPDDARKVLSRMKERGIDADEATFTILIEAAFAQLQPDDHEGGVRTVKNMLEAIETAGLKANMQNYGKIIYHLLQGNDNAKGAVQHVLSHLWDRGYELTPHIYTMLVDHYFSMTPPDINAVETLLERRRIFDYDDRDIVLYDRLARGYSQAGMPEKALLYYYKLARANVNIRLYTQAHILNALLKKNLDEQARQLVESARAMYNKKRENGEPEQTGQGDHLFWRMVAAHGL